MTIGMWTHIPNLPTVLLQCTRQHYEIWCRELCSDRNEFSQSILFNQNWAYLTPAIPKPPMARWNRAHIEKTEKTKQNSVFPRISFMQDGNSSRISCMKMSPPLMRFTLCSKSTRSSTWMVVLVLRHLFWRYCMILNLTNVPVMSESAVLRNASLD